MRDLQIGVDFGRFPMRRSQDRLDEEAFILAASGEQERIDPLFAQVIAFISAGGSRGNRSNDVGDSAAEDALCGRDGEP